MVCLHLSYDTQVVAYLFMYIPKRVWCPKVAKSVVLALGIDSSVIIVSSILVAGEKNWS